MRANYQHMVAVCFLIALLTTSYAMSTIVLQQYRPGRQTAAVQKNSDEVETNSDIISETFSRLFDYEALQTDSVQTAGQMINAYTSSQSIFFSMLNTVNELIADSLSLPFLLLLTGTLAHIIYRIFGQNILLIGQARFFLETRVYHETRINKIFFLYKLNYIFRPAWTMLCRNVYQFCWNLTIVGGIIKYYEYSMIPFILAENPSVSRKDAFFLSRKLMDHNKWNLFLLHLSFIGWELLSLLTFGLLDFLYLNPYKTGTDAEFYMALRKNYIRTRSARYELFNDPLLEGALSEDELLIQKALYDDSEGPYTKIAYFAPRQYPVFLYSIQPPLRAVKSAIEPKVNYKPLTYLTLFFVFSILGWIAESAVYLIQDGILLNRSFLHGPWVPLYGVCGVLTLFLLKRMTSKPIRVYCLCAVIYALVSYLFDTVVYTALNRTPERHLSYFLQSGVMPFIGDTLILGLIGCFSLYYLAPKWNEFSRKIPRWFQISCCIVLILLSAADFIISYL